jgi:hypothetical protein
MAKQTTKAGLLHDILVERRQLEKNLAGIHPSARTIPGVCGEWSVKDILSHLAAWEQLFLGWYQAGVRGEIPVMPAPGYNWHTMHELNAYIYTNNCRRSLDDVEAEFSASYQQILALVQALPEEDIFTPGRYAWLGQHRLVDFMTPNTSNHYAWAKRLIRKWVNTCS